MRVCSSCGRENPDNRDFCECGEYLRWDPTGAMPAITPEAAQPTRLPPPDAANSPVAPPAPPAQPPAPAGPASPARPPATLVQPSLAPAPPPPGQPAAPDPAAISLRLPEGGHGGLGETLAVGVEPGGRGRVHALVRNQSGIVDNYELSLGGFPDDWWSIVPNTVYLIPFGTSGMYEQEVEVHLHPPRTAKAEARIWDLEVAARSRAHDRQAAAAPLKLGIQPFEEFKTTLSPERASGRKKAQYDVAVKNTANAAVTVALDAADTDNELAYRFTPATLEIEPGESLDSKLLVKPLRQRWIGRPQERRIQVFTKTGEEVDAKTAADIELPAGEGEDGAAKPKRRGLKQRLRITGPRAQVGTSGVRLSGPRVAKPRIPSKNVDLMKLKAPAGGAPAAQMALMPNQVLFRHKAWLPWWIALLVPLLILLALFLILFLPKTVVVPDLTGAKSTFEAEQKLTAAQLKLNPNQQTRPAGDVAPGTVLSQTPAAGAKAEKDSAVTILVAVGDGTATVPKITGLTLSEADKVVRSAKLTLGQVSPQPPDPKAKIESQIPAQDEVVQQGTPVGVFVGQPAPPGSVKGKKKKEAAKKAAEAASGGPVPALVAGTSAAAYAQQVAKKGIIPKTRNAYSAAKVGTVFATKPRAGTELEAGDTLTLFVSAGLPKLAFDDGDDIQSVDGISGDPLDPIASGSQLEKDPTFAPVGRRVAYVADQQISTLDLAKPNAVAKRRTSDTRVYTDPSWAPTTDRDVLAMASQLSESESELCLGEITQGTMAVSCKQEPGTHISRAIHWSRNGRTITAFASRQALQQSGIMQWRSTRPFSTDPQDWSPGEFVTVISKPGEGVIDAALSPNGKTLAVAARSGSEAFRLYLAKPGDFVLSRSPRETRVRACKIAWRPDSKQLAVVQADSSCREDVGTLVRVSVNSPDAFHVLSSKADNPAFEPLVVTR